MKTAFVIFDRMTALDLIGVYDPLTRLKSMNFVTEFNWQICAFTEEVSDDNSLRIAKQMDYPYDELARSMSARKQIPSSL